MSFTEEEKKINLEVLNNFIGYGNPNASIYFIGIEEHSPDKQKTIDYELEKKRLGIYKQAFKEKKPYYLTNADFISLNETYKYNKTYSGITKIFNTISPSNMITPQNIGDLNIDLFIANLYPLARATTKDSYNCFIKEFAFDNNFNEWSKKYWTPRKEILKDFFSKYLLQNTTSQKYIFCLGTSNGNWETFEIFIKELLNDASLKFECKHANKNYYGLIKKDNLIFYCLYHPASRQFYKINFVNIDGFKIIL